MRRRKRLPEPEAAYWLLQLLDATRYLHGHAIIHRDLKLGNLFIGRDMALRVGDFGLATQVRRGLWGAHLAAGAECGVWDRVWVWMWVCGGRRACQALHTRRSGRV